MSRGDGIARGDAVPPFSFPAPVPPPVARFLPRPCSRRAAAGGLPHCPWRIRRGGGARFPAENAHFIASPAAAAASLRALVCPPRAALAGAAGDGGRGRFCPFHRARGVPCAAGRGWQKRAGGARDGRWPKGGGAGGMVLGRERIRFARQNHTFRTARGHVSRRGGSGLGLRAGRVADAEGEEWIAAARPRAGRRARALRAQRGAMRAKSGLIAFKWINLYDEMGVFLDTK